VLRLAALTELLGRVQTPRRRQRRVACWPMSCRAILAANRCRWALSPRFIHLPRRGDLECRCLSGHSDQAARRKPYYKRRSRGAICHAGPHRMKAVAMAEGHEQYAMLCAAEVVVGSPLRDERGDVRGAWLFAGPAAALCRDDVLALLRAASRRWLPHSSCSLGHKSVGFAASSSGSRG